MKKRSRYLRSTFLFFPLLLLTLGYFASFSVSAQGPALKTDLEKSTDEGIKVTNDFEKLIFRASPQLKNFVSFFDTSLRDDHLLLYVKKRMISAPLSQQVKLYKSIHEIWRNTKYVKKRGYGEVLTVLYVDTQGRKKTIAELSTKRDGVQHLAFKPDTMEGQGVLVLPRDLGEDKWPIVTNSARLYCKDLGYGSKAVYLITSKDDKTHYYAVNGTARGRMKSLNLEDALTIMKPGYLPYHLEPFIQRGLKECT